jgi:HD-GYP domain-containing protein (c-di-GMP phosphodiesterase class II)
VDQDWIDFLEALAGQAAIAIDNANLFNELRLSNQELMEAYDTTLEGWAGALELRDDETEGHSARVTEVTVRLARKMGVPESEIVNIRRGALMHDIGKIGIPDEILLKQGPLAEQEWEIMRLHPVFAYELLAPIQFLRSSIDIPYAHHEHWDGNGYPRGLSGTGIPLAARIFAVVDVWDALRSDRPYRQAWDPDRVREYLQEQSGRQFDPKVVDAFLSMEGEVRRVHSRTPNPATSVVTGN